MNARTPIRTPTPAAPGVFTFSVLAACVLAQQVGGKVVRDGLFLTENSAAQLPQVMLFGSLLSAPVVFGAAWLSSRLGPRRVAALLLALNGGLFALERSVIEADAVATAWLLYLHVAALGGTTLSAFFANVSEYYDPHAARLASARVFSGAAVGGMIGGLTVSFLSRAFGLPVLLLLLAAINLACAIALSLPGLWPPPQPSAAAQRSGFALASFGRSNYVRSITYLVLLTGFSSLLLDFYFKRQAVASLGDGPALFQLLAAFHTGTAIATTLVQLTLARVALERLGLAGTLATLPASLLLGGALAPLLPPLWSAVVLRGASSVLEASLFRSAYEPLYTPLSQRVRRSMKTLIDVIGGRMGEAVASGALLWLAAAWPDTLGLPVLGLALLVAAAALMLSLRMQTGYVAALAASLHKGSVQLREADVVDSTTRLALTQTHMEIERAQLLAEIAAQRASRPPPAPVRSEPPVEDAEQAQLLAAVRDLLSAERVRVNQVLSRGPLDLRLVPLAIGLLEHAHLVEPVTRALRAIVDRIVGQLVDALQDRQLSAVIRRRIPRILHSANHAEAAHGLVAALSASERVLRFRAASALANLTANHPEFAPDAALVSETVRSELRAQPEPPTLQHVFALLSLALDRDALRLARQALTSGDVRQRGTALEYLHSTLHEPLRSELVAWAEARPSMPSAATVSTVPDT